MYLLLKMVLFHDYVSLPEGKDPFLKQPGMTLPDSWPPTGSGHTSEAFGFKATSNLVWLTAT